MVFTILSALIFASCKKQVNDTGTSDEVSQQVKDQITAMGFTGSTTQKIDEGYLVEGDIIITDADLSGLPISNFLRVGETEQYRTTNLVTGLPRTITVSLSNRIPSCYGAVLDEMVNRYNAQNLLIHFTRVASGGDIVFAPAHGNYLASSGFPSSQGVPYPKVNVNTNAIGCGTSSTFINYAATIFAHEVGHCIGFRHTDYFNRAYSCGGSPVNEGASTVGAILIPGTPSGGDPNSFMLSCIGSGVNRPFNTNDRTALNYLY
jgi:hypothetical protein